MFFLCKKYFQNKPLATMETLIIGLGLHCYSLSVSAWMFLYPASSQGSQSTHSQRAAHLATTPQMTETLLQRTNGTNGQNSNHLFHLANLSNDTMQNAVSQTFNILKEAFLPLILLLANQLPCFSNAVFETLTMIGQLFQGLRSSNAGHEIDFLQQSFSLLLLVQKLLTQVLQTEHKLVIY